MALKTSYVGYQSFIEDNNGNYIFPITDTSSVRKGSKSLDEILVEVNQVISANKTDINNKMTELQNSMNVVLGTKSYTFKEALLYLYNNLSSLQASVNTNTKNISSISDSISKIESSLNAVKTNVTKNSNNISSLNTTVDGIKRRIRYASSLTELQTFCNQTINDNRPTTIYLLPGTYTANSPIRINQDTKIIGLGECTILCNNSATNIVFTNNLNNSHVKYTGPGDIVIENFNFDGKNTTNTMTVIGLGHAANVEIKKCFFRNFNTWHNIELNGCSNCLIEDCSFENYGNTDRSNATEVIQIDAMFNSTVYPWTANYDGTACKNIEINRCKFNNIMASCIGNHSFGSGVCPENIHVTKCEFKDCIYGITLDDVQNLNVHNCLAKGVDIFIYTNNAQNKVNGVFVSGNYYEGMLEAGTRLGIEGRFMKIGDKYKANDPINVLHVWNNHITKANRHGIGFTADFVQINNNTFYKCGGNGIYCWGGFHINVNNNTCSQIALTLENCDGVAVGGNVSLEASVCMINNNDATIRLKSVDTVYRCYITGNIAGIAYESDESLYSSKSIKVENNGYL